nr:nitrate reductase associated protein [Neosynechococcus sphagnicola]
MTMFFEFEADFVESLRCIPMAVRCKLDTCGIKLKLAQWHQFSQAERLALVELPCVTADEVQHYREQLQAWVVHYTGDRPSELAIAAIPPWLDVSAVPESVQQQAGCWGVVITQKKWAGLSALQRFALIKLAQSKHEHQNLLPALREFHLLL